MKKNKSQIEFEKIIRSERFLFKFCPYTKEEIEKAIEMCISLDKDEEWLFNATKKYPNKNIIDVIKLELSSDT